MHSLLLDKKREDLSHGILLPVAGCRQCAREEEEGSRFLFPSSRSCSGFICTLGWAVMVAQCKDAEARFWWKLKCFRAPPGKKQQLCQRLCRPQFLIPQGPVCSDTIALAKCLFLLLTASGIPNSSAGESPAHRARALAGHPHHPIE